MQINFLDVTLEPESSFTSKLFDMSLGFVVKTT